MATNHEEHAHEHGFVEIADSETISAVAQTPHEAVMLQFNQRGFALELSFQEALELGAVMEKVTEHVKERQP